MFNLSKYAFLLPEHGLVDGECAGDGHDGRPAPGRVLPPPALAAAITADVMLGHGGDGRRSRDEPLTTGRKVICATRSLFFNDFKVKYNGEQHSIT